jgi:hypothetical protein
MRARLPVPLAFLWYIFCPNKTWIFGGSEMSKQDLSELFRRNERLTTLLAHAIASLMLACAAVSVVQLGQYLLPSWHGAHLIFLIFIVSLEAMVSHRLMKGIYFFTPEWMLYRATEWVTLLVGLKLVLYAVNGFGQLWVDLPLWQQNFTENFFTGEYIFDLVLLFFFWSIASLFSDELDRLEGDEKVLRAEREIGIIEHRPEVRRSLANLILAIGGAMIILAAFLRLDWQTLWGDRPPPNADILNILIYFLLALALLSLTQFSIMRVHWILNRIPIEPNLAARWLLYAALFLLFTAALAFILPTRYSVGLLDILGYLLNMVLTLFSVIAFLLTLPIILLVSLLAPLFGRQVPQAPAAPHLPPPPPITNSIGSGWPEILKSILFWLIFVGVMGFSLYNYLIRHKEWLQSLRQRPVLGWLLDGLAHFWYWLRRVNQSVTASLEAGINRFRARQVGNMGPAHRRFISLRRLSPRQKVLFYYLAMLRRSAERGLPRKPYQTPNEYAQTLEQHLPVVDEEVNSITGYFNEARYSRHAITTQHAGQAQQFWARIRDALRKAIQHR